MQIVHDEGESQATRFVRELTGIGIRNNEKFGFTLPPYNIKRKLYDRYCYYNRWKTKQIPRGNCTWVADYELRKCGDELKDTALWPTGPIVPPVCMFSTFCTLWKRFFPLLKILAPSKGICLQWHIFKNQYKYTSHKRKDCSSESDDDSSINRRPAQFSNELYPDTICYSETDMAEQIVL